MNFIPTQQELTECDRERIHEIASVQAFGGFIKLNSDWTIAHRSANCPDMLGLDDLPAIGLKASELFLPAAIEAIKDALIRRASSDVTPSFSSKLD